jgi:hypothetical protein
MSSYRGVERDRSRSQHRWHRGSTYKYCNEVVPVDLETQKLKKVTSWVSLWKDILSIAERTIRTVNFRRNSGKYMQCHQAKYMGWLGRVVDAGDWAFAGGGWVGSLSRALQFSIFMGT